MTPTTARLTKPEFPKNFLNVKSVSKYTLLREILSRLAKLEKRVVPVYKAIATVSFVISAALRLNE